MIKYSEAIAVANKIKKRLKFDNVESQILIVGSLRRKMPFVNDIDLLVVVPSSCKNINKILPSMRLKNLKKSKQSTGLHIYQTNNGSMRREIVVCTDKKSYKIDLFITKANKLAFALLHFTGSADYNIRIRAYVKKKGMLLNQYGLYDAITNSSIKGSNNIMTEKELTKFIGVTYYPPHKRI